MTRQEPSSLSYGELYSLHRVFNSILNVKREKRKKYDIVEDGQKKGNFNSDVPINRLPCHHIRECWCDYLNLTWQYAPRISDVGLVTHVIVAPEILHVARVKTPKLSVLAFLFQFVCNVLADEIVMAHFNRRIAYDDSEGKEHPSTNNGLAQRMIKIGKFAVPTFECEFLRLLIPYYVLIVCTNNFVFHQLYQRALQNEFAMLGKLRNII